MTKNVTLVLSGGGARGIAHIGVIEELESRGYVINSVAGTSMGALVGGVYTVGKLNEFKEWLYSLDKQKIFRLLDFAFNSQGLIKGDRVLNAMKKFVPDSKIEDLKIKYTATAFDIVNDREIVFQQGNLYEAIRASISIPTVFTPVISGKSLLVDGGVVNNIPINNAVRTENDHLIAVYVNAETPVHKPNLPVQERRKRQKQYIKRIAEFRKGINSDNSDQQSVKFNYFNLINNSIASSTNRLSQMIIQMYSPDMLIEISRKSAGTFDFFKAEELVEIGRFAAKRKLDTIRGIGVGPNQ
jgi:NTE family protein